MNHQQMTRVPRYVPPVEAAAYARCSLKTVRRRIADGSIPAYRFGPRSLRIDLNDIDDMLRRLPTAGGAA